MILSPKYAARRYWIGSHQVVNGMTMNVQMGGRDFRTPVIRTGTVRAIELNAQNLTRFGYNNYPALKLLYEDVANKTTVFNTIHGSY